MYHVSAQGVDKCTLLLLLLPMSAQTLSTWAKITTLRLGPIPPANRADDDLGCAGWGLSPITTAVARVT